MARPRKDLATHALQGTTPHYEEHTATIAPGRPKYPRDLTKAGRKVFKRICCLLESRRALTEGESELVRLYAILFDRHARAMEHVTEEGEVRAYTRLDSNGAPHQIFKENLWLRVAKDAEKQMVAILDRLGLSPIQRSKVKPAETPKPAESVDPNDRLLEPRTSTPVEPDPLADFDLDKLELQ